MTTIALPRRQLLLGASALLACSALPNIAQAGPAGLKLRSGLGWASGVRDSSPDSFANFRQRRLDTVMVFPAKIDWGSITKIGKTLPIAQREAAGRDRKETLIISYAMFPKNQNPRDHGKWRWKMASRGGYDHFHRRTIAGFKGWPQQLVFRIGWEWNTRDSFFWSCADKDYARYFKDYFRRIVTVIRRELPDAKIDWCSVKKGEANAGIQRWYPGSDFVDIIGHDKYDWYPALKTQEDWEKDYKREHLGGPAGIGAWLDYAKSEGKPMSVPEWGLMNGVPQGGGDNALFVDNMMKFFRRNRAHVAYECYFNNNNHRWLHRLQNNRRAARAYNKHV